MEKEDLILSQNLMDEVYGALGYAAEIIKRWLITFTPVGKTGITARSWQVVAVDRDEYYVTNTNEPIITYLIEGTAAHDIYPGWAEYLHWVDDSGADHFAKHVYVRGIVGTDIEGMALDEVQPELDELWSAAVEAGLRDTYE